MRALTTINNDRVTISFPEIRKVLECQIEAHLQQRIEKDREEFWRKDLEFKTKSECMDKIAQLKDEMFPGITGRLVLGKRSHFGIFVMEGKTLVRNRVHAHGHFTSGGTIQGVEDMGTPMRLGASESKDPLGDQPKCRSLTV